MARARIGAGRRAAVTAVVLGTLLSGCSQPDSEAGSEDVALGVGPYVVRSAARFQGDTLTLSNALTSTQTRAYARLVPPDTRKSDSIYTGRDTYSGYVNAVPAHVQASGTQGPQVEFILDCHCRTGTDLWGQPKYEELWFSGRYAVRDIGGGRVELREVPTSAGDSPGSMVDTLERAR